jgi:hypothetical protein
VDLPTVAVAAHYNCRQLLLLLLLLLPMRIKLQCRYDFSSLT